MTEFQELISVIKNTDAINLTPIVSSCPKHSQRTLHFGDVEHTIYISDEYILEQRANSNCSLGEADVIQNVMKGVLGEDEKELETTVAKRTKSGMLYVLVEKAN